MSATALPIITGGVQALYPATVTYVANTGVSDTENGSTSRWVKGPVTVRIELAAQPLTQALKNTLKSFFASAKGQFSTNLQVTLDQAYSNLSFDEDQFEAMEEAPTQYGVKWSLSQTLGPGFTAGSSGGAFPTLSTGAICQLSYSQKKRFQTQASKMAGGPKYTYAEFAAGLTNFPTDGLMAWSLGNQGLNDSEVSTLTAHWLANWGNCFPFPFTDEDGTTYSDVYYASPELRIVRNSPNNSTVAVSLIQTF